MIEISCLSSVYTVKMLTEKNIDEIISLCKENTLYYEHCPPFVTEELIKEDITALPPGKSLSDKYYLGFYDGDKLMAVMDLIDSYPDDKTAFIGFFMMDKDYQGNGTGSKIISELIANLTNTQKVRLAWVKTNPQAEHFWLKNGFTPVKETLSQDGHNVILAERDRNDNL